MGLKYRHFCVVLIYLLPSSATAADDSDSPLTNLLEQRIISNDLPTTQIRNYTQARILPMPEVKSVEEWERHARRIREAVFERIVFRGEAANWRDAETRVEWLEIIEGGPGYRIRKLRYEALPGVWIPALLYEPENLVGKVPVVLNVNGHDGKGKATPYKQIRCINLAKRGMLALNVEWFGMGQLATPGFNHYRLNQLDLCGTSGLAPFYLSMKRGIDLLLSLEHADPMRVAVAGLSGGGWQTIVISALDERVTLANPVAGYSSFRERAGVPADLGDSEQSPVDMATVADYLHLTALRAPRPTLLTYNAADNCCFVAEKALPPLIDATLPIYQLYGKDENLRSHVNNDPGTHNFDLDNRQQFYRMLGDFFFPEQSDYDPKEIPSDDELKTKEVLHVDLPADNADFHTLAMRLLPSLPKNPALPREQEEFVKWQQLQRANLREIVRSKQYEVDSILVNETKSDEYTSKCWQLKLGENWTIPAVEFEPSDPKSTVIVVSDEGRKSLTETVRKLLDAGRRVLAVDPFNVGESRMERWQDRYCLFLSAVGDRPLGLQASQLTGVARWCREKYEATPVEILAYGRRSSLMALIAAALEESAIGSIELHDSLGSLKEIVEQDLSTPEAPELFCFGLLEKFDILQLAAMVAPRPVKFAEPSRRVRRELAGLKAIYDLHAVEIDPLR